MTKVLRIQLQTAIHVLQHQQYGVVVKVRNLDFASLNLHSSCSTRCLLYQAQARGSHSRQQVTQPQIWTMNPFDLTVSPYVRKCAGWVLLPGLRLKEKACTQKV